jgi:hypothetical protein
VSLSEGFISDLESDLTFSELGPDEQAQLDNAIAKIDSKLVEKGGSLPFIGSVAGDAHAGMLLPRIYLADTAELAPLQDELARASRWVEEARKHLVENQLKEPPEFASFAIDIEQLRKTLATQLTRIKKDGPPRRLGQKPAQDRGRAAETIATKTASRDPIVRALTDIIADPRRVAELIALSRKQLVGLNTQDPRIREEVGSALKSITEIAQRTEAAEPEDIRRWAQQAAEHSIDMLPEDNPFSGLLKLRMPHLLSTLNGIIDAVERADAKRPRQVRSYANLATEAIDVTALTALGALTYMSFFLAQGGGTNLLLAAFEHLSDYPAVAGAANAALNAIGLKGGPSSMALGAKALSTVGTAFAFAQFLPHRDKWPWKMPWRSVLGLAAAGTLSTTVLLETVANQEELAASAKFKAEYILKRKGAFDSIRPQIEHAKLEVLKAAIMEAYAESKRGGVGPKTMTWLFSVGLLNREYASKLVSDPANEAFFKLFPPDQQATVKQFLLTDFNAELAKKPVLQAKWLEVQKKLESLRDPSGLFGKGVADDQALQVLAKLIAQVLDTPSGQQTPEELLEIFRSASEDTGKGNMVSGLISTSHVLDILRIVWKDAPEKLGVHAGFDKYQLQEMQSASTESYKALLSRFETLSGAQMKAIRDRLDLIADTAGVPEIKSRLTPLFALATLQDQGKPLTAASFGAEMSALPNPKIQLALQILNSPQGIARIDTALRKSGVDVNLLETGRLGIDVPGVSVSREFTPQQKLALLMGTLIFAYAIIFDTAIPEVLIKGRNTLRIGRFNREVRQKNAEIDQLLDELSITAADYIEAYMRRTGVALGRSADGSVAFSAAMTRDLRAAFIRGRLERMCDEELVRPEWGLLQEEVEYLRSAEPDDRILGPLQRIVHLIVAPIKRPFEAALGFKAPPKSVGMTNARIRWFSAKMEELRDGGPAALTSFLDEAYWGENELEKERGGMTRALASLRSAILSGKPEEKLSAEKVANTLTLKELAVSIPALQMQIAVLKRGRHEILANKNVERRRPRSLAGSADPYTQKDIDETFLLGAIESDIARYEHLLHGCRTEGRRLLTEIPGAELPLGNIDQEEFRDIFTSTSETWQEPDMTAAQKNLLIRQMRERLGIVTRKDKKRAEKSGRTLMPGTMTTDEFNGFVTGLGVSLADARLSERAREAADASPYPELQARGYSFQFGHSALAEGPTVYLAMKLGSGVSDEVLRIPYPGRMPDPLSPSVEKAMEKLTGWITTGVALPTLHAAYVRHRADRNMKDIEDTLITAYRREASEAVRVPLTKESVEAFTQGDARETAHPLFPLVRHAFMKRWFQRHDSVLARAYHGYPMNGETVRTLDLAAVERLAQDRVRANADRFSDTPEFADIARELQEAFSSDAIRGQIRAGFRVYFDPKTTDGKSFVVAKRSIIPGQKDTETRFTYDELRDKAKDRN